MGTESKPGKCTIRRALGSSDIVLFEIPDPATGNGLHRKQAVYCVRSLLEETPQIRQRLHTNCRYRTALPGCAKRLLCWKHSLQSPQISYSPWSFGDEYCIDL